MQSPAIDIVRNAAPRLEMRAQEPNSDGLGLMEGRFSVFNTWYQIDSVWEGSFLERVAPGAFADTISSNRANMRVLYDHGFDPQIGNKVLGNIDTLEEDDLGARFGVPLFDTSYNRDLLPGLRSNAYGSSFRFRVNEESWVDSPARSEYNPTGLPERTIRAASVAEFGPVTFPASPTASAGMAAEMNGATDRFYDQLRHRDSSLYAEAVRCAGIDLSDLTGASRTRSSDRGVRSTPTAQQRRDHDALLLLGIIVPGERN